MATKLEKKQNEALERSEFTKNQREQIGKAIRDITNQEKVRVELNIDDSRAFTNLAGSPRLAKAYNSVMVREPNNPNANYSVRFEKESSYFFPESRWETVYTVFIGATDERSFRKFGKALSLFKKALKGDIGMF